MTKKFHKALTIYVNKLSDVSGNPVVLAVLILVAVTWFIAGIAFQYNETWYDIMDVFVFLTTFFLVFIVQASQNADTRALQHKLDEIIDSLPRADNNKKAEEKRIKRDEKK